MLARASLVQDSGVYSNLGAHLRRTDRMRESRATYAAAIRADPKNAEAYIGLGKCFTAPAGAFSSEAKAGTHSDYLVQDWAGGGGLHQRAADY